MCVYCSHTYTRLYMHTYTYMHRRIIILRYMAAKEPHVKVWHLFYSHNNWGPRNSFQRLLVPVYYWKIVEKPETDPQLLWEWQYVLARIYIFVVTLLVCLHSCIYMRCMTLFNMYTHPFMHACMRTYTNTHGCTCMHTHTYLQAKVRHWRTGQFFDKITMTVSRGAPPPEPTLPP
jgi:hypothetical protein